MASDEQRRRAFARFVDGAIKTAQESGLTIPDIEERTGVSKTKIYRWRTGDWRRDPQASEVKAFCKGLGIAPEAAYKLLDWQGDPTADTREPQLPPDFREVLRRLRDPHVSSAEKAEIRSMIRYLARRRESEAS